MIILDYGMANLRSVQKAFEAVGCAAEITADPKRAAEADRLVLPGVGAFRDAIVKLRETGLDEAVLTHIRKERPFLGICLGLQMLFTRSHEDGTHAGLDLLAGDVVRFQDSPGLKVPHMGWNSLEKGDRHRFRDGNGACPLFRGLPENPQVYFVHSYFAEPVDKSIVAGWTEYPAAFASVIWKGNVVATQFHPEKSQSVGLKMLKNFAEWK